MWNRAENQIELYLIRHGMTLGNVEHRYIGRQTDEPLSEDGRQQLEKRKEAFSNVSVAVVEDGTYQIQSALTGKNL